jgi:hypothetical protein
MQNSGHNNEDGCRTIFITAFSSRGKHWWCSALKSITATLSGQVDSITAWKGCDPRIEIEIVRGKTEVRECFPSFTEKVELIHI